jgi:hypothetical protein
MENFHNSEDYQKLIDRITALSPNAKAQFGKMNVNEMICHLNDSMKVALGEIRPKHIGNFITRMAFLKRFVLSRKSFQKEKVETAKEVNPHKEGSKPTDFQKDKETLFALMAEYKEKYKNMEAMPHPIFGTFSHEDWGRQIYMQTVHHLEQFGG